MSGDHKPCCLFCELRSNECPCCLDRPDTGRTVFPCGHNACYVCTPKLPNEKCPTCKAPFNAQQLVHIDPDKLTGPPYKLFQELLCNTRVRDLKCELEKTDKKLKRSETLASRACEKIDELEQQLADVERELDNSQIQNARANEEIKLLRERNNELGKAVRLGVGETLPQRHSKRIRKNPESFQ